MAGRISLGFFYGEGLNGFLEGLNGFLILEGLNSFLASDLALRYWLDDPAHHVQASALAIRCGSSARPEGRSCQRAGATIPQRRSLYRFALRAYNDMIVRNRLFTSVLALKIFSNYFELFLNNR